MNKQRLWLNLKAYHFDNLVPSRLWNKIQEAFGSVDTSTKAFAGKLSRKLGWTNTFALDAIAEYKKFVYLAVISDFNATPSKVLDQVWHEHLLFNKAYREFCNEVIYYTLDHNPELLGTEEGVATFNIQYLDTLDLYKHEFGVDPPGHIWSITKFTGSTMASIEFQSKKKKADSKFNTNSTADNTPLFLYFNSPDQENQTENFPEFNGYGGGNGGGAGVGGEWESSSNEAGNCSSTSCSSSCGGGGD